MGADVQEDAKRFDALVRFLQKNDGEEELADVWFEYARRHLDTSIRATVEVRAQRFQHLTAYLKRVEPAAFERCEREGLVRSAVARPKSRQSAQWMNCSGAEFLRRQAREPVLMTNQSTEAVGGAARAFQVLDWSFSATDGHEFRDCWPGDRVPEGEKFYPLTNAEAQLIFEDWQAWRVPGYKGAGWHLGTTAAYKGKKWLAPTLELQHNGGPFTQNRNDPSPSVVKKLARGVVKAVQREVKRVGGFVRVEHDAKLGSIVVVYVPMTWAVENLRNYEGVKAWLRKLPKPEPMVE